METCRFSAVLSSLRFLPLLAEAVGCGRCCPAYEAWRSDGGLQTCERHAAQFESATELMAEHCPCPGHRGPGDSRIARCLLLATERPEDSAAVRALWRSLQDARTDRAYAGLRRVFPMTVDGTLRSAFSERPRRWVRSRGVARQIAPGVLEQEALAALILAAGFGHPAADLPDLAPLVDGRGRAAESRAVPMSDLHGRPLGRPRTGVPVSEATGEFLLRKLHELCEAHSRRPLGRDAARLAELRRELAGMDGAHLARRLGAVLLRLCEHLPDHFSALERARGRSRGAPYRPVPQILDAEFSAAEHTWLGWTLASLRQRCRELESMYDLDAPGTLDWALGEHLGTHPERVPARWSAAATDPAARADLLTALQRTAESETDGGY